ncbi:MAG: hypothetical protein IJ092_12295 [Atopobiaceae bacterium]|nr:hypothetical protein [Atopobiaceae bacterium]
MFRERERFERIDVPTPSAFRNMVSLIVIGVVALVTIIVCARCWHKANQMNYLNNEALYDALYDQKDVSGPTGGRVWTDHDHSNVLFFIVDDIHAETPQVKAAQILVRDVDDNTAIIANLPINTKLVANESNTYLERYFSEQGAAACLAPFTDAANVHVSHVIVATERIWSQLGTFEGPTLKALLSKQTNDFATISSDFSTGELVKFAEMLQEIGIESIPQIDAPCYTENLEDGTEVAIIDRQELPTQLKIFAYPE